MSDPEKKQKWLNHESVDDKGIPSDTETLTDATAYKIKTGAWLLLAYAGKERCHSMRTLGVCAWTILDEICDESGTRQGLRPE